MSAGRLYYVMGPSDAGKDDVLGWLRDNGPSCGVLCAHHYITRPAQGGGENHVALSVSEFELRERRGLFVLTWQAHGLRYGLGKEIEYWLSQGVDVLVNGSRDAFSLACARFNNMVPVLITASRDAMAGNDSYAMPENALTIVNDSSLPEAGEALLSAIRGGR